MNLNPQIVEAVEKVREMVMANPDRNAKALVQPLVAQALGIAVQNAVAHLQSLQTLEAAVTGQAAILILEDPEAEASANRAVEIMQQAVRAAIQQVAELKNLAEAPETLA
jgi:Killing trait